jgi:hypothetical protein
MRVDKRCATRKGPVRLGLALATIVVALTGLPSSAEAQSDNDDYLGARQINDPGTPLLGSGPDRPGVTDTADTTNNTVEQDVGGSPERTSCPVSNGRTSIYGRTAWWDIHPDVNGVFLIDASGFDAVIGVVRYRSFTDATVLEDLGCLDEGDTLEEVSFIAREGQHYSIQVGGFAGWADQGATPGQAVGGGLRVNLYFFPDRDLDGVFDGGTTADRCPTEPGPGALRGCPDSDGDNIPNIDDECDNEKGSAPHGGCPDSDGDGVRDLDDQCPSTAGPVGFAGCPDADGDGLPENPSGSDKCPGLNPDRVNRNDRRPRDGCPDILGIRAAPGLDVGGYAGGAIIRSFTIKNVPAGARVIAVCRLPSGRRCGRLRVGSARVRSSGIRAHAARTFRLKLTRKRLRFGTRITARVTARYARSRYIRVTVVPTPSRIRCRVGPSPKKLKPCK